MTLVILLLVLLVALAGLVLQVRPRPQPVTVPQPAVPSILDDRLLEYVIVTLRTGTTFGGVLYAEDRGAVVLCKAEQISRDGTKVQADGEIVLLRDDIDFIQRP